MFTLALIHRRPRPPFQVRLGREAREIRFESRSHLVHHVVGRSCRVVGGGGRHPRKRTAAAAWPPAGLPPAAAAILLPSTVRQRGDLPDEACPFNDRQVRRPQFARDPRRGAEPAELRSHDVPLDRPLNVHQGSLDIPLDGAFAEDLHRIVAGDRAFDTAGDRARAGERAAAPPSELCWEPDTLWSLVHSQQSSLSG